MPKYRLEDTKNLTGMKDLADKLAMLGTTLGGKTLRQSLMNATTPLVKKIKLAVPVGTEIHKTYKGNIVSPGFLKRSIKRVSRFNKRFGSASVRIGVRREAFYGINFLDRGINVTQRKGKPVKPYSITGTSWFKQNFINSRKAMEDRLKAQLKSKIDKIARR